MECGICYHNFNDDSDFFNLNCCKNNRVCNECINLLKTAICPFCRAKIPDINRNHPISKSYSPPSHYYYDNLLDINYQIDPMDDMYLDSRILRRQINRMRKLQERERDRLYNKNLAKMFKESKKYLKNNIRNEINNDIRDFELFEMD